MRKTLGAIGLVVIAAVLLTGCADKPNCLQEFEVGQVIRVTETRGAINETISLKLKDGTSRICRARWSDAQAVKPGDFFKGPLDFKVNW